MPVNKKHDEFYTLDMNSGWEVPAGYPGEFSRRFFPAGWTKPIGAARVRDCCVSNRASTPLRRSLMNTGKRFISSRAI